MTRSSAPALLSLWNSIAPDRIPEYNRWHTLEHVPERVWVPGFISGSRYVAADDAQIAPEGQSRYFTLYELQDLDCLESAAYQDLVDRPTPWSASMRPAFSDFVRKTGPVLAQAGSVQGSALVVVRMVWPDANADALGDVRWTALAAELLGAGADLCVSRVRIQQALPAGPQAMRNADRAPAGREWLCQVETAEPEALSDLAARVDGQLRAQLPQAPAWTHASRYRFLSLVRHADVQAPQRPAPRLDLMPPQPA